jgi:hypothetical protein
MRQQLRTAWAMSSTRKAPGSRPAAGPARPKDGRRAYFSARRVIGPYAVVIRHGWSFLSGSAPSGGRPRRIPRGHDRLRVGGPTRVGPSAREAFFSDSGKLATVTRLVCRLSMTLPSGWSRQIRSVPMVSSPSGHRGGFC